MTKKELQVELIGRTKRCDEVLQECYEKVLSDKYDEVSDDFLKGCSYIEGRKNGLKLALELLEHLDEGKA